MKTTVQNKFHNYQHTINHRGDVPSVSALRRAIRASKPADCKSDTLCYRDDGLRVVLESGNVLVLE